MTGNAVVYQNPVLAWRNEISPDALPEREPPQLPFQITRSEVVVQPERSWVIVHIWYALIPAVPR